MKYFFVIVIILSSLVSCTITKRVHSNGFHIQWNSNPKKSNSTNKAEIFQAIEEPETSEDEIETAEMIIVDSTAIFRHEKVTDISPVEKRENNQWHTSPVLRSNKEEISVLKSVTKKLETKKYHSTAEKKERKSRINWSTVGFFALLILLGVVCLIAWFGSGLIAQIAVIIIATLAIIMLVVVTYYFFYFLWYLLFGWMM